MDSDSLDSCFMATLPNQQIWVPSLFSGSERTTERFWEFFTVNIRNRNTRKAYLQAVRQFAHAVQIYGVYDLTQIRPMHVAAYIEKRLEYSSKPTVKQHLAALRALFDWMVVGHAIEFNPASAVRGPKYSVKKGKTPVLSGAESRALLNSIDDSTLIGKRDKALIALMIYSFARIGAALSMNGSDYYIANRKGRIRLHEKGGKEQDVPCHRMLDEVMEDYIVSSNLAGHPSAPLFQSARSKSDTLSGRRMLPADAYRMIRRRAVSAGIQAKIGNHTFRATGITAYLRNGGRLEIAQQIAGHESSRTTGLYDRREDDISIDEIERIIL